MYIIDYHTHSEYSFDGREPVLELVKAAIEMGVRELCITDHYECMQSRRRQPFNFEKAGRDILALKDRYSKDIKLLYGIELGQMHFEPELCKKIITKNNFDFIIGSIHNLKKDFDLYFIDYSKENAPELFEQYLDELLELAKTADYDVLGHLTYPLRYMARDGYSLDIKKSEDKIDEVLKAVISRGRGIEVNVSGLRQPMADSMPSSGIVRRYRELGGEIITLGSDAHRTKHVGQCITQGLKIIEDAGFSYITTFEGRRPSFKKIGG